MNPGELLNNLGESKNVNAQGCCCLPTPMTLASAVSPAGSVHKSRGDNVVRMWMQLKR